MSAFEDATTSDLPSEIEDTNRLLRAILKEVVREKERRQREVGAISPLDLHKMIHGEEP